MQTNQELYKSITDRIIAQLEKGNCIWKKSWAGGGIPTNFSSKKAYRGLNIVLLSLAGFNSNYWLTFNQASKLGGHVKKGSKSTVIIYWNFLKRNQVDATGTITEKTIPMMKYYRVFNLEQINGIDVPQVKKNVSVNDKIESCESLLELYKNKPVIKHEDNSAYYVPSADYVNMPKKENFDKIENYYSVLFHELGHSTGAKNRLNRKSLTASDGFGGHEYSKEELVAEFSASFLCAIAGIEPHTIDNSAGYIKSWIKALKNDSKLIIYASTQASKAVDYFQNQKKAKTESKELVVAEPKELVAV